VLRNAHYIHCPHQLYGSTSQATSGVLAGPSVSGGQSAEARIWLAASFPHQYLLFGWSRRAAQWRITEIKISGELSRND
jgi:hypothetical protein